MIANHVIEWVAASGSLLVWVEDVAVVAAVVGHGVMLAADGEEL